MARPLRLEYPGALYHVTARGNAREPIFLDLQDSQEYRSVLALDADQGSKVRRNLLICRAHLQCGYTLSEIAAYLDIHYTTVSKVVNETS